MYAQASGFQWVEGPVVVKTPNDKHFLLFSDVKKNVAYAWHAGKVSPFLEPSGCSKVCGIGLLARRC